ncbi:uncharacterized protein [Nerophis lumbriciformis]|uniref:uncharacterized protein n=1 Tax=Nerophis lumbriciformis TaxID=546530 RepID=UPI003BAC7FCA
MKTHAQVETPSPPAGGSTVQVCHDYQKVALNMQPASCMEQKFSTREDGAQRSSLWTLDSSSQAFSGPEDTSTDPQWTRTETSTLTFVDGHAMEESGENPSLPDLTRLYLKDLVLIDDDDDGDMSLREKTVNNVSVMDGGAADLVRGRLPSTSSRSVTECQNESCAPKVSSPQQHQSSRGDQQCCTCIVL